MSIFVNLPLELVNLILSYDNVIRFRNGKFIDQIASNDSRRKLVAKIPVKWEHYWVPDMDIMSSVVLHINYTKYYAIDYKDYVLTVAILQHSGVDYENPMPGDSDESTMLIEVENVYIT